MKSKQGNSVPDGVEIAPGHFAAEWKGLELDDPNSPHWTKAIEIFECRIIRRLIEPVDVLIAHEIGHTRGTFGFAILAIDCIIVETIEGFREGKPNHDRISRRLITSFLEQRDEFKVFFKAKGVNFYEWYRCALLHSGQTDGDYRIQRRGPLLKCGENGRVDINRTAFHKAVKREFEVYLKELADAANSDLRIKFRKVMDAICGVQNDMRSGANRPSNQ